MDETKDLEKEYLMRTLVDLYHQVSYMSESVTKEAVQKFISDKEAELKELL